MKAKFWMSVAAAVLLGFGITLALGDTTTTYTNKLGQVVTVVTTAGGVKTTTITQPSGASAMSYFSTSAQTDSADDTDLTAYVPRYRGDILLGKLTTTYGAGTNVVWIAVTATTNGWTQITP